MSTDLSIEVGHLYLHRLDGHALDRAAVAASRWIPAMVAANPQVQTYSVSVLLDDYTRPKKAAPDVDVSEAQRVVVDAFAAHGVTVDYVVLEAACAATVGQLRDMLASTVLGYEYAVMADERRGFTRAWLSNGEPARFQMSTKPKHDHSIALDVQLWSEEEVNALRWSCPMVAAWWQLIRLGASEVPAGTLIRAGAPPLMSKQTLTLLSPDYLEVEHAVLNILKAVQPAWPFGPLLGRISYVFVPGA